MNDFLKHYLKCDNGLSKLKELDKEIDTAKFLTAYHQFKLAFESALSANTIANVNCQLRVMFDSSGAYLFSNFFLDTKKEKKDFPDLYSHLDYKKERELNEEKIKNMDLEVYYKALEVRTKTDHSFQKNFIENNGIVLDLNEIKSVDLDSLILSDEIKALYSKTLLEIEVPDKNDVVVPKIKI